MGRLKSNIMGIYFDPSTRTFASKGLFGMFTKSKSKGMKKIISGLKSGFMNGIKNAPQTIGNAVVENTVSGLAGMAANYGINKGMSLLNKQPATPPNEEEQVRYPQSGHPIQSTPMR